MKTKEKNYVVPSFDLIIEDNFLCADSADSTVTDYNDETFNWD